MEVTVMAGTKNGGRAAATTNKKKYGADFYARIGAAGGKKGRTGGFASSKKGDDGLTGRERAALAGARGGRISRRTKKVTPEVAAKIAA
jgi:hypothetical protein